MKEMDINVHHPRNALPPRRTRSLSSKLKVSHRNASAIYTPSAMPSSLPPAEVTSLTLHESREWLIRYCTCPANLE